MSVTEATFLAALHAEPGDEATWLALADWLDDDGQTNRAELVRLTRRLRSLPLAERSSERADIQTRLVQLLNAGVRPVVPELVNSVGMRFALIPSGRFLMGSSHEEQGHNLDEAPQHEVEISRPFYLGVFPVTQGQWQQVMGNNPSHFCAAGNGKDRVKRLDTSAFPVEQMSWQDVMAFLDALSRRRQERKQGRTYRLPTEAEWEYGCRGGASHQPFHFGGSLSSMQANCDGTHPYGGAPKGPNLHRTCAVGSYPPNAFGLYDMHGQVFERCSDWYQDRYYDSSPSLDPAGPPSGSARVVRGGCWTNSAVVCRSARRYGDTMSGWMGGLGIRLVLVASA